MTPEPTVQERAAAPSSHERTALVIFVVCTIVFIAALLIPKVHGMYTGLTLPTTPR